MAVRRDGARESQPVPPADDPLPIDPDVLGRSTDPRVVGAIAVGGALGAPARYGVAQVVHVAPDSFPWATFWTNVSGSLALGLVLVVLIERFPPSRYLRAFVATGFLGAYTTYSTFAVETDLLLKDGDVGIALAYVLASLGVGVAAAWAGMRAGRALVGRSGRAR
jgi:CrcB protein